MSEVGSASGFESRAAGLIHRVFLVEEECQPLPPDPSPAMLVARVGERLSLAAWAIEEDDELDVAAFLLGAAGFALTAISWIAPDQGDASVTERKDLWLEVLEEDVLDALESKADALKACSLDQLLRLPLCAMSDALQAVAELEGVNALCPYRPYREDGEEEEEAEARTLDEVLLEVEQSWKNAPGEGEEHVECRQQLLELIAESLWETAVEAATAAEVLAEKHETVAPVRD